MATVIAETKTTPKVSVAPAQVKLVAREDSCQAIAEICGENSNSPELVLCGDTTLITDTERTGVKNVWAENPARPGEVALSAPGVIVTREEIKDAFERLKGVSVSDPSFAESFRTILSIPEALSDFAEELIAACYSETSLRLRSPAYMPEGRVHIAPDQSCLVLEGEDYVAKISLQTTGSEPQLASVIRKSELDEQALVRDPEFRIASEDANGWPLFNGKLVLQHSGGDLIISRSKDMQPVLQVAATGYALEPLHKGTIVVAARDGTLTEYSLSGLTNGVEIKREIRKGDAADHCENVQFDSTGKVLVVTTERKNGAHEASFVSVQEGTTHCIVPVGRADEVQLARDGTLFVGARGNVFRTNLRAFLEAQELSAHGDTDAAFNQHLRSVIQEADIEPTSTPSNDDSPEGTTAGQQNPSEALVERFGGKISEATEQQLTIISRQIETLKNRPDFAPVPDIFIPVENLITARETQLAAESFIDRLSVLTDGLGGFVQVTDVKRGKAVLAEFKEWRSGALIDDESLAAALTEMSTRCESAYADALNKIQATLKVTAESRVGELARKLSFVHSFPEFDAAQATFQGGDYHELCELLLDTHFKEKMQGRIDTALAEKRVSLESQSSNLRTERDEHAKTQEENLRALCGRTLESLSRVATPQSLEVWQKSNALYQEFNTLLVGAPHHLAIELRASLEQALTEKRRAFGAVGLGHFAEYVKDGQATFGKQKLAVFPGYSGLAIPTVVPSHIGSPLGKLRFTGIGGMAYQPDAELVPIQIDHPSTKEAIATYRPEALSAFAHRVRTVPLARPTWRITPWVEENLEKLAWAINLVQKRGQGLVIIESEPGLGKNILLEMLACATNRELLTQPFYKQMTIDDLTFMATLNDNNTELVPAKFFNYVQTPGAIVFLDEFSAASDALQKKLNGLFTQDRTLSVSFGDDAKADRSTIFIAAINPLGTGGTNALNEDLKSRSIRVRLSFPEFTEKVGTTTRFRSDEAEILYQYVDCLKELTIDEFRACWNKTVNSDRSAGVDQLLTAPRVKAIQNLKTAIEVANKVREAAKATARGNAVAIPISFTWGMRQQEFIAAALNYSDDIKEVMQSVILSNVDNPTEEMAIEGMIKACT